MPKRLLPQSNSRSLLAWFVVILAISVFSLWRSETLLHQTHNLAEQNKQRVSEISHLRDSQIILFKLTDKDLCVKFTVPIRAVLQRSLASLPTIEYYKTHQTELRAAIKQTKDSLKLFSLESCNHLPSHNVKPLTKGH